MKKIIKSLAMGVLCTPLIIPAFEEGKQQKNEMDPKCTFVFAPVALANRVDNEVACYGDVRIQGGNKTKLTLYLQGANNGLTFNHESFLISRIFYGTGMFTIQKQESNLNSLCTYRVKLEVDVYDAENYLIEHAEAFSEAC